MRKTAFPLLALPLLALPFSALAQDTAPSVSEVDGARILQPWAVLEDGGLQVYMRIENTGSVGLLLSGGETADGAKLALQGTEMNATTAVAMEEFPIAPGVSIELEPGAMSLGMTDASDVSEGDRIDARIFLDTVEDVEVEIEVFAAGTEMHPSNAEE